MRIVGLVVLWMVAIALPGIPLGARAAQPGPFEQAELGLSGSYRQDQLDWNIAGATVNVLSELEWEDLNIYELTLHGSFTLAKTQLPGRFYGRGAIGYGWIVDGDNQDSDYAGNNRTQEFSRSDNDADDGNVLDLSLGGGMQFRWLQDRWRLAPLVGFSYHEQNLTITDGFQTVSSIFPGQTLIPPEVGPFPGLDSSYDTRWYGPWVGLDAAFLAGEKITLSGGLEFHWGNFEAEADWNLRADPNDPENSFRHFEHEADAYGLVMNLAGRYDYNERWTLLLAGKYAYWTTYSGVDRVYFLNGEVSKGRLNEVNWESYALSLGAVYRF